MTRQASDRHDYVLMAYSDGHAFEHIMAEDGLGTQDVLDFLWEGHCRFPKHRHVIYGGSYDTNCWMRGLAWHRARLFWQQHVPIRMGRYLVEMDGRHFRMERNGKRLIVWDVWRFWQGSFVKALKMCLPEWPDLEEIEKWKQLRSDFDVATLPSILQYTKKELLALVALMRRLFDDLAEAGLGNLARLDGAGSIAARMLQIHGVKQHMGVLPPDVLAASYHAYAGARVELWKYGMHDAEFHTYDRVSAYPYAMLELPSLAKGTWQHVNEFVPDVPFAVYRLHFKSPKGSRGYPFFQRVKGGNIYFPREVEGWYWKPEIDAAIACGFPVSVKEGWIFHPGSDVKPFGYLPERFAQRAALKAAGKMGAQLEVKLGLNSTYGKTAQTLGGTALKPPPYHQPAWAGHTTSHCRAAMFKVAMQKPHATCYIATDGIGSTEILQLDEGKELGQWEYGQYRRAMLVQAGVYFLWDDDVSRHDKYRGFDANSIEPLYVLLAWKMRQMKMQVPATRFITLGSALAGHARFEKWCTWQTVPRDLDLSGGDGKRYSRTVASDRPWLKLHDLHAQYIDGVIESEAYQPKWRQESHLMTLDGVNIDTFEEEMVVYDRARRTTTHIEELSRHAVARAIAQGQLPRQRNDEIAQWLEPGTGSYDDDSTMRIAHVPF